MSEPTAAPDVTTPGDEFRVPPLGAMMAYRGVHALSDLNPKTGRLRATHYATCLVGGRDPMWGVWTVHGVFLRFFGSKEQIREAYPRKTWRLRSATWNLVDIHNKDAEAKRKDMREIYHRGHLAESGLPVAAMYEDGAIVAWGKRNGKGGEFRPLYAGPAQVGDNVVMLDVRRRQVASK